MAGATIVRHGVAYSGAATCLWQVRVSAMRTRNWLSGLNYISGYYTKTCTARLQGRFYLKSEFKLCFGCDSEKILRTTRSGENSLRWLQWRLLVGDNDGHGPRWVIHGPRAWEKKLAQQATQKVRRKGAGWAGLEIWPMANTWKINPFLFSNPFQIRKPNWIQIKVKFWTSSNRKG
jgi:hypothetical protein